MNSFEIVTDSSCDLPAELVQELDIQVVPLGFLMEGKPYRNYPDNRRSFTRSSRTAPPPPPTR